MTECELIAAKGEKFRMPSLLPSHLCLIPSGDESQPRPAGPPHTSQRSGLLLCHTCALRGRRALSVGGINELARLTARGRANSSCASTCWGGGSSGRSIAATAKLTDARRCSSGAPPTARSAMASRLRVTQSGKSGRVLPSWARRQSLRGCSNARERHCSMPEATPLRS